MTQVFDLTAWIYARPIDAMDTNANHVNDCDETKHDEFIAQCQSHKEWQDWFHVKPWATDSIYNYVDWALINRASWEVHSNE